MGLSHEHVEPKILAKIKIYVLTRAELLFHLCYEIPCSIGNELMEEGCPIPNCHRRAWTVDFTEKFDNVKNESSSEIELTFPHYTTVLVRNEIKLYTFSSWIADIGGFMGLLLGESLVSYVLLGTHWMTKLIKK